MLFSDSNQQAISAYTDVDLSTNIGEWRTKHAQAWLVRTIELPQYVDGFKKAAIDGTMLATYVTEDHLRNVIGTCVRMTQYNWV